MNEYEFVLSFALPPGQDNPEQHLDALFEAGCDDAVVGTAQTGAIALEFIRKASSASKAVNSAMANVLDAIPGAELIEAKPDLVGLTDVAEILHCSRQNIRKYMVSYREFPHPTVTGKAQLWHLWEIAKFNKIRVPEPIAEISRVTFQLNLNLQKHRFESG